MEKTKKDVFLRKCPVCGKMFWCPSLEDWVYKMGFHDRKTGKISNKNVSVFCSYHCMRERQKLKEATTRKHSTIATEGGR